MSEAHVCRLCRNGCNDAISLCDNYGHHTEVYAIAIKFFHPSFLDLENGSRNNLDVLCFECWHHISGFNNFQQTILLVQAKLLQEAEKAKAAGNSNIIAADRVIVKVEEEFVPVSKVELPETSSKSKLIVTDCELQFEVNIESLLANGIKAKVEDVSDVISVCDSLEDDTMVKDEDEFEESVGSFVGGEFNNGGENSNPSLSEPEMMELPYSTDEEYSVEVDEDEEDGCPAPSRLNRYRETDEEWKARMAQKRQTLDEMDNIIAKWKPILECELCTQPCTSFTVLQDHFREIHPGEKCYVVCCQRQFQYRCRIRDHIRVHLNPDAFHCKDCNRSFSTKWTLDSHMFYTHKNTKEFEVPQKGTAYKCRYCDKVFKVPYALREHLTEHTGEYIHKCLHCPSTFKYRSSFRNHLTQVHPDKFQKILKPNQKETIYLVNCKFCTRSFNYRTGLYHHLRVHHPEEFAKRRTRKPRSQIKKPINIK